MLRPLWICRDSKTAPFSLFAFCSPLLKHGGRSFLEYAKNFDLKSARLLSNPDLAPHLEFVDLGGHGYAKVRLCGSDAHRVCLHPTPDCAERKIGRWANQVSGITHCCLVEERRASAAKNIGSRRRRWTGDLTDPFAPRSPSSLRDPHVRRTMRIFCQRTVPCRYFRRRSRGVRA